MQRPVSSARPSAAENLRTNSVAPVSGRYQSATSSRPGTTRTAATASSVSCRRPSTRGGIVPHSPRLPSRDVSTKAGQLHTSNPIESLFAGVRLRTDVAKRMRRRENAPYLVFKIAQRLEHSWRPLNGGLTIMTLLLGGARFVDGVYVPAQEEVSAA